MDENWKEWLKDGLSKGCDPHALRDILLQHFQLHDIQREMGKSFPHDGVTQLTPEEYHALANIRITRIATPIDTQGRVQLYTLDNFMTADECETIIALSYQRMRPSEIPRQELYEGFRTSSSCDLVHMDHPLVEMINNRIAETIGINPSYADGIQAQIYEVGQQFKAHWDYFTPGHEDYTKFANIAGNRTWTFMVYLNDTTKGGGTYFTALEQTFYPKQGSALIWNNLHANGIPNPDTMHWGMPVEEGNKAVITKWFRENGVGQMILD